MEEFALGRGFEVGTLSNLVFGREIPKLVRKRNKPVPEVAESPALVRPSNVRQLYHTLSRQQADAQACKAAREFLDASLLEAARRPEGLPAELNELQRVLEKRAATLSRDYRAYLKDRHKGQPRRYFNHQSHALHFLQAIAPTRMVEGAWLYGFLRFWRDAQYAPLCKIYLKSLGEGREQCNQVRLYQHMLDSNGCQQWQQMDEQYYVQGLIRLALGHHVEEYLPEIIGFNLGYEQVSLPMLIAAYELSELEVQPHYFTLHATEDDACIASAIRLLQPLLQNAASEEERLALMQRVNNGYKLNQLGMNIDDIVASFDLQQAFLAVMQPRSAFIERVYRIDCMERGIRGRWPDSLPLVSLMQHLCNEGWMQGDTLAQTRLWQTMERGGILPNGYEAQVLNDWFGKAEEYCKRLAYVDTRHLTSVEERMPEVVHAEQPSLDSVSTASSQDEVMACVISLMSPQMHHTQEGLKAARVYKSILEKGSELYSQHYAFFLMRQAE